MKMLNTFLKPLAIKEVAKKVGILEQGYRVVSNCNEYGGQTVFQYVYSIS